jgi:ubiquinone/menaquinone biosynthesis C-methylase UbiE
VTTGEKSPSMSVLDTPKGVKLFVQWLLGQWIFDLGAGIYNRVNSNPHWQENCAHLIDNLDSHKDGLHVLDLGIGPGVSAFSMGRRRNGINFIGLDISEQMLTLAQENRKKFGWSQERLSLLRGDALRLPLQDNCVDAATGHSFLYLLPDYRAALRETHRVVRSGGQVAFLEPHEGKVDWRWLFSQRSWRLALSLALWRFYNWIHGRFSKLSMQRELERAGFTRIETEVTLGGFGIFGRGEKP